MELFMRLDDACEKRNVENWDRMEKLLDRYNIKPLVGVIPHCEDPMMENYEVDDQFWNRVESWITKGWEIALHGYNHLAISSWGGVNPVNNRSEFAGLSLDDQKEKIKKGVDVFKKHGIEPNVFFAPSHTFDENTIDALKECSKIRIISDTIANKPYRKKDITFIPQQSGRVRNLPFHTITYCYHPNTMQENDFEVLERFLKRNQEKFKSFPTKQTMRKFGLIDWILRTLYFIRRK